MSLKPVLVPPPTQALQVRRSSQTHSPPQAARLAAEKRDAEARLQAADLLGDRALGDVSLLRRAGKAAVAGGGIEHPQGVQIGQAHRQIL